MGRTIFWSAYQLFTGVVAKLLPTTWTGSGDEITVNPPHLLQSILIYHLLMCANHLPNDLQSVVDFVVEKGHWAVVEVKGFSECLFLLCGNLPVECCLWRTWKMLVYRLFDNRRLFVLILWSLPSVLLVVLLLYLLVHVHLQWNVSRLVRSY